MARGAVEIWGISLERPWRFHSRVFCFVCALPSTGSAAPLSSSVALFAGFIRLLAIVQAGIAGLALSNRTALARVLLSWFKQ